MDELVKTLTEEYAGAGDEFERGRYKNATILFSKALFALCDYLIVNKIQRLPKNHAERFKILQHYFPEVYIHVDAIFDTYTDAYSKPILKETCEGIKDAITKIRKATKLPQEIEASFK